MSVRGEFARALAETAACLSESDAAAARRLADELDETRALARQDLQAAARGLLAHWEPSVAEGLALPGPTGAQLVESSERMLAIARIILGL